MTDDELEDWLAPLRSAEPDMATREANQRAALDAVRPMPWWRRSVSVPMPVAIGAAAALLLAVGWGVRSADSDSTGPSNEQRTNVVSPIGADRNTTLIAIADRGRNDAVYESASYVPGIGFVERVSRYPVQE